MPKLQRALEWLFAELQEAMGAAAVQATGALGEGGLRASCTQLYDAVGDPGGGFGGLPSVMHRLCLAADHATAGAGTAGQSW